MSSSFRPPERKRPNVFGDDIESDQSPSSKKVKSNNAHVPSYLPPPMPSFPPPPPPPTQNPNAAAMIAAKRLEIQAKLAAMRPPSASTSTAPPPPSRGPLAVPGLPKPDIDPNLSKDVASRVAEARKLVEAMQARKKAQQTPINPYLPQSQQTKKAEVLLDPSIAARGGLSMAAHPLLMDLNSSSGPESAQSKKDRYKPMTPKFSTTQANSRAPPPPSYSKPIPAPEPEADLSNSPYFDPRLFGKTGTKSHMGRGPERSSLKFNQRGKFVKLGESLRAEMRMEELKKRILESARKAGLEEEMEKEGRVIKRPPPPEIEWWDTPFLPSKSYDSYEPSHLTTSGCITPYIQHPIQIPAPGDKVKVEPKALFLTKKEMKKMRRQRRLAELKDKQDRQKMGLLPADAPKVKLNNMMRVLTQEAILDPTKIEAKVRRETVARAKGHDKMNNERKLTDEQRREKEEEKKEKDAKLGIQCCVFKIKYLSNKLHKIKLSRNAIQNGLTGRIIHNPKFCLVLVEGGRKGIKFYRHLVLNRIDWTEEARDPINAPAVEGEEGIMAHEELIKPPESLKDNTCEMVWEGYEKERMFGEFRNANCPSENSVKSLLGVKLEGVWDLAKADVKEED